MNRPMTGAPAGEPARIGISGTGFVARALYSVLMKQPDFAVTGVLTRRPIAASADAFPEEILTNSREALIERADIVFECSGDTPHAAEVLLAAGEAGRKLVTMNAEAQVTVGSALVQPRLLDHRGARRPARGAGRARCRRPRHRLRSGGLRQPQGLPRPQPQPREHALLVAEAGEHAPRRHLLHRRHQDADRADPGGQRPRRRHRPARHDRRRGRRSAGARLPRRGGGAARPSGQRLHRAPQGPEGHPDPGHLRRGRAAARLLGLRQGPHP